MQNKLWSKKRYNFGRKPESKKSPDLQWPQLLSSDPGWLLASSGSAVLIKEKASSFCSYLSLQWKDQTVRVLGLNSALAWQIESPEKKSHPALTGFLVNRRRRNAAEKCAHWARAKPVRSISSPNTNSLYSFKGMVILVRKSHFYWIMSNQLSLRFAKRGSITGFIQGFFQGVNQSVNIM